MTDAATEPDSIFLGAGNSDLPEEVPAEEIADREASDPDPARVAYTTTDFDVDGLVRRLRRRDIVIPTFGEVDEEVVPLETARFQRPLVWTKTQMDRFIESLLLGYPIPGIFLVQQSDRRYLVLDGQQRLKTLRAFVEGMVNKKEFSLQSVADRYKGLTFATLSPEQRRQIENTFLQATIVQASPQEGSLDAIYQVFERLNSGGTQLTPHEIRVALYAGDFVNWITSLASRTEWRQLYGPAPAHLRDQELIMRIVALDTSPEKYKRPLKKYLNDFSATHRNNEDLPVDDTQERFLKAATALFDAQGSDSLRPGGNAVNAAWTEAIFVGLMNRLRSSAIAVTAVSAALERLGRDSEMTAATTRATSDDESVKRRLSKAQIAFEA